MTNKTTQTSSTEETPEEIAIRMCGDDLWANCQQFPKSGWACEVENNDTILGYWSWVVHQAESEGVELESLRANLSDESEEDSDERE